MSCLFLFRNNDGCDSTRRFGSLPPRTIAVYLSCISKEPCVPGVRISFPCLLHLSKFLLCCKHFNDLGAEFFGGKKSLAHLWLSREAKVVQSYGEFLTRQNFWPIFNNLSGLSLAGPPPGRAVSRLRVQRYGDFFTSTKFFGHFF